MSNGFRILHLADSHIGGDLPARPRSNRPRRGDDIIDSYRRVLAFATEHAVDLVIHAGDVFDLPQPNNAALTAAAQPLLAVAAAGIPVVIVPGNHECSVLPDSLFFMHANLHITRHPHTFVFALRGTRVAVATFPCLRRQSARLFDQALADTHWQTARADVNILAVHQTFESAICGPVGYQFRSGDDVVERDSVPAEFDYVAAGHIHRHQVLESPFEDGPPLVYAGSPDRISMAERDEPKGAVLIEADSSRLSHRFIEHEVRPMHLIPLNITGCSRVEIKSTVLEQTTGLPANAVVLLRLSGETTNGMLRGLNLSREIRTARPDLLLTISSQAIEFVPERYAARVNSCRDRSVFSRLNTGTNGIHRLDISQRKALPTGFGTYAFHDRLGRLLYIGKARNVRSRVGSHLTGRTTANHFAGWTKQIAEVEVRPAHSELEALLIEAELIRKMRPPFNRQMRLWSRYCYVCQSDRPYGQLQVCRDPIAHGICYGPFRSQAGARAIIEESADLFGLANCPDLAESRNYQRFFGSANATRLCQRYFAGVCGGPCAGRVSDAEYFERLSQRHALLGGYSDEALLPLEEALETIDPTVPPDEPTRALACQVHILRGAYERAALLRQAERLLGSCLILPGPESQHTMIQLTSDGILLSTRNGNTPDESLDAIEYRVQPPHPDQEFQGRLPKAVADCFCTAVRALNRQYTGRATLQPDS